jgi:hypothetical protein
MAERDIEKLLGGFATGTLTEEERKALFEAALGDQQLFDSLADEQALKELLHDPVVRRRVLEALRRAEAKAAESWSEWLVAWLHRPKTWAVAGGLAVAVLAVTSVTRLLEQAGPLSSQQAVTEEKAPVAAPMAPVAAPQAPPASPAKEASRSEMRAKPLPQGGKRVAPEEPAFARETGPVREPEAVRDAITEAKQNVPETRKSPPGPEQAKPSATGVVTPGAPAVPLAEAPAPGAGLQATTLPPMQAGKARDLFYTKAVETEVAGFRQAEERAGTFKTDTPGRAMPSVAQKPLGLRYSILKRGPEGSFSETDPTGLFTRQDEWRLAVEVNDTGYLYVLKQDSSGIWTVAYPVVSGSEAEVDRSAAVQSGTRYVIPAVGAFQLEGPAGATRVLIVVAREPQGDLRPLLRPEEPGISGVGQPTVSAAAIVMQARKEAEAHPLLVEKVDAPVAGPAAEQAVYVVNPLSIPHARVLAEVILSRQ